MIRKITQKTLSTLMSALSIILVLVTLTFNLYGQNADKPVGAYNFPVRPGSDQWRAFTTHSQKLTACMIPEDVLNAMSTQDLITTCLDYPLLMDIWAYDDQQIGFEYMKASFNGFSSLLKRSDAATELISYLKKLRIDDASRKLSDSDVASLSFKYFFLQMLLTQDEIVSKMTREERTDVLQFSSEQFDVFQQNLDLFGSVSLNSTSRLMGKLLLSDGRLKIDDDFEVDDAVKSFINKGNLTSASEFIPLVIFEKMQFENKENGSQPKTLITLPTVVTYAPIEDSYDPSTLSYYWSVSGNVTSSGGATVTERGVCFNTFSPPTTKYALGSGTGVFAGTLSPLQSGMTYYCRAYAKNSAGTAYGSTYTITTCAYYNTSVNTPKGSAVSVRYRSCEPMSPSQIQMVNSSYTGNYPNAIYLATSSGIYNCHSYAWHQQSSSNPYWMNNPTAYWTDGSYVNTSTSGSSYRWVYCNSSGVIFHSAIAISYGGKPLKSKWGAAPLFAHDPADNPYVGSPNYANYVYFFKKVSKSDELASIEDGVDASQDLLLYPNPSHGTINISIPEMVDAFDLEVYDYSGRLVYNAKALNSGVHSVDLSGQPAGCYAAKLFNGDQVNVIKFIIE